MTAFYHVCFTVPDLDAAMTDLTAAAGMSWSEPAAGRIGEWDYRIVFTAGDAPHIELIEAPADGPWGDTSEARFHHLGFWSSDVTAGAARLTAAGFPEAFSGCPYGRPFVYHRLESLGAQIELVDTARQSDFLTAWNPGGAAMPVISED
ncbi:VOC family protein [Kitasatospora sp. NPDC053057]|uniref:VOC family protein n=1 Tax=Kitasatospora sp. NPDC053057 TaxID=3364062 RepID=UPI0037C89262